MWEPTEGEILWEGKPVHVHSPNDSEALGITTIYQDLALCDNLDIVQNMFLGHERLRHGLLDEMSMELAARQTLVDLHVTTVRSIRQPVASLSGGQRQSVAVAKAVMRKAKLVIMDEPTAALGVAQTRQVLDLIKRLSSQGTAVLLISHNLNDVFEAADVIAILYLGRLVVEEPRENFDRQVVVDYMTTGQSTRGRRSHRTMTDTIDEPVASSEARTMPRPTPPTAPSTLRPSSSWPRTFWRTLWAITYVRGGGASAGVRAAHSRSSQGSSSSSSSSTSSPAPSSPPPTSSTCSSRPRSSSSWAWPSSTP